MQTAVKLTIELCHGNEMPDTFTIKGEVPYAGPRIIDTSEKALGELRVSPMADRGALAICR